MNICDRRHRAKHPWKGFSIASHKRPRKTSNIALKTSSTAKNIAVNNFCIVPTSNLCSFCCKATSFSPPITPLSRSKDVKQRRWRWQREREESNRFRLAKQQLCTCFTLSCTFLCRHCATTT